MNPGDIAVVKFAGNGLHGKKVRIHHVDAALDIAHPDCPERLITEIIWVEHPTLPRPVGLSREHIAHVIEEQQGRLL